MELRIIGCTGSMSGPASAASCYLIRARGTDPKTGDERWWNLVLDMGPGSFGALWRHINPVEIDAVIFSHCHADHIGDVISLHVHRRWGPGAGHDPIILAGPEGVDYRVRQIDGCDDTETYEGEFIFTELRAGQPLNIGPMTIMPVPGWHSVPSFGVRIEAEEVVDGTSKHSSLFYTGDTDECLSIIEGAKGVDLLLSEAGFTQADTVRGIHLDGVRAGRIATEAAVGRLVVTHIQPWTDRDVVAAEVKSTWTGQLDFAQADQIYEV